MLSASGLRLTPAPYEKAQASDVICKRAAHPGKVQAAFHSLWSWLTLMGLDGLMRVISYSVSGS